MNGTATRRNPGQDRPIRDRAPSRWRAAVPEDARGGHGGLNDPAAGPAGAGRAS